MTSKELVIKTLEFKKPERIPRQLWLLPWAVDNFPNELEYIKNTFPDDIVHCPGFHDDPPKTHGNPFEVGTYIDEWGCIFENRQAGVIGEVKKPAINDMSNYDLYPPLESLKINKKKIKEFCKNNDNFLLGGCCPRPFERIQFLCGTENIMMYFAMHDKNLKDLIAKVHKFYLSELKVWAQTDVDGLMFMDDWGAQRSLLISPDMWRDVFKPLYAEYIDIAHKNGKKAFMHSDGYIIDILPDLIELGLDAINCQIFCMGLENLGQIAKGKITFWGEIDRQNLLPNGSTKNICKAVNEIHNNLYSNGGVIAQLEFGPGAKPENVMAAFNTWNQVLE